MIPLSYSLCIYEFCNFSLGGLGKEISKLLSVFHSVNWQLNLNIEEENEVFKRCVFKTGGLVNFFRDIFSLVVVTCNFIYFISLNIFITTLVYSIYIYIFQLSYWLPSIWGRIIFSLWNWSDKCKTIWIASKKSLFQILYLDSVCR